MWSTFVWSLTCMIIVSDHVSAKQTSATDIRMALPTSIPDTKYEQVIAKRYLFVPFANESTAWPSLTNVHNVWQVASLPQYHSQAAEGFWLLTQTITDRQRTNSTNQGLQMSFMSLADDNRTIVVLPDIDMESFLVVSHNKTTAMTYTAALISLERMQLILCHQLDATSCKVIKSISFPSVLSNISKITAGLFVHDLGAAGWLYIATNTGLHGLDLSTFTITPYINQINVSVSSLAWSSKHQTIFAGTETKLWIYSYGDTDEKLRFEHVTGLIDAPINSLVYNDAQNKLWIGQETGITLLSPIAMSTGYVHWVFSRLAGQISNPGSYIGHLPFANITTLGVSHSILPDGRVWLGSRRGVMRFDPNDIDLNAWRVFNSARYMPNRESLVDVLSLTVLSRASNAVAGLGSAAVAVTSKGLAVIYFEMWTLAQKAKHFQDFFNQSGRHDKYNLVSGCGMSSWGDSRTCVKQADDNDGLWTSMYLTSQIFRYVVTQDATVKASAWTHFEALELLNQVSGIPGYPGRSFAKRTDFPPDPNWHLSPVYPSLQFKGDTSSDEIVGHELVYPLVYDLLASNDDERERAYSLFYDITNHILTHDWYLVGENHTRTTWGFWNPKEVNNDSDFQGDRGLNSLGILTYLLQTYAYSGDERFLDGAKLLIESYRYDVNLINQKMIAVCEINYSDDEMAYLSYFNFVYAINKILSIAGLSIAQKTRIQLLADKLLEYMKIGLDLSHKYVQMEKSPFYNFIYCYASGQVNQTQHLFSKNHASSLDFDCNSLSKDGIWYMQRWPLELINWPQFNSDRLDVQLNVPAGSCGQELQLLQRVSPDERLDVQLNVPTDHGQGLQSLQRIPPDERTTDIWNSGGYDLDNGNGFEESDPTAFLISYWGMRYLNLLGE